MSRNHGESGLGQHILNIIHSVAEVNRQVAAEFDSGIFFSDDIAFIAHVVDHDILDHAGLDRLVVAADKRDVDILIGEVILYLKFVAIGGTELIGIIIAVGGFNDIPFLSVLLSLETL